MIQIAHQKTFITNQYFKVINLCEMLKLYFKY